jgi:hypothetical protein
MTQTSKPSAGQKIRITRTAPVGAQFVGRTGTVQRVMGNAILIDIDGHGAAFIHLAWGKGADEKLGFEVL